MAEPTPFGAYVKELRNKRGYSAVRVQERGGLSRTSGHIDMIESGERGRRPGRNTVLKIAKGLDATDEERDELLRLAGHAPAGTASPEVTQAIRSDLRLTSDQKDALVNLYSLFTGQQRGAR